MESRRLMFVTAVMLSWGCAAKPPPPAAVAPPSAPAGCQPLFVDLRRTLDGSAYCNRDEECTAAAGTSSCEGERVDSQPVIQQKREALRQCLGAGLPPNCSSLQASCRRNFCLLEPGAPRPRPTYTAVLAPPLPVAPDCRRPYYDLHRELDRAAHCDRDVDCTVASGDGECEAERVDSQAVIQQKREALRQCQSPNESASQPPNCSSRHAFCFGRCQLFPPEKVAAPPTSEARGAAPAI